MHTNNKNMLPKVEDKDFFRRKVWEFKGGKNQEEREMRSLRSE